MSDEISGLAVKIAMDDSSFTQGIQGLKRDLAVIDSEFKVGMTSSEGYGKSLDGLKEKASSLGEKIVVQKEIVQQYSEQLKKSQEALEQQSKTMVDLKEKVDLSKAAWEESKITLGENTEAAMALKKEYQALEQEYSKQEAAVLKNSKAADGYTIQTNKQKSALNSLENELQATSKEIATQSSSWSKVATALEPVGKNMEATGKKMSDVGQTLNWGLTLPIIAVGAAATKMSIDFGTGMAMVGTIADTTQTSMSDLSKGVIKLSDDTGKSATDMTQGLYQAISSGVQTGDALNFMAVASKAAIGGFADTETAVDGLTTVLNSYGMKSSEVNKISNQMIVTQNLGKTTLKELSQEMGNVAPTAAAANVSTKDLFSSLAVLTANGMKTQVAVTSVKAALSNIIKPSAEASAEAEKLGLQFNAAHLKSVGWQTFLEEVATKTNGNTTEMSKLFGSVEALNGVLTLTSSQGMDLYNTSMGQMNSSTNYTNEAFNKMEDTTGAKLTKSFNELKNAGIQLGESMTPIVTEIAKDMQSVANIIDNMSEGQRKLAIDVGLTLAVVGPLLTVTGAFLKSGKVLIDIVGAGASKMAEFSAASKVAGVAVDGAAVATEGLTVGFGAVALAAAPWILGIAAVAGGSYLLYKGLTNETIPSTDLFADKIDTSTKSLGGYGLAADSASAKTIKISDATKQAVGSYMTMDDSVKKNMMNISLNSNNFTTQAKTSVIKNFTDMTNKVGSLNGTMKDKSITDFTNMVTNTGTLSATNKATVIAQYTDMVSKVSGLSQKQKDAVVKNFTDTLTNSVGITKQQADGVVAQFTDMGTKIKAGMDTQEATQLSTMTTFFAKSAALSTTDEARILTDMKTDNNNKKLEVDAYEKQISDIYVAAAAGHRDTTQAEKDQINRTEEAMRVAGVKSLSDDEVQSKVILARMASYGNSITLQQASDVIKNANSQRDKSVAAANSQYDKTVVAIIKQRDETGTISAAQAEALIKDAGNARDKTISAAETQRSTVVSKVTSMNGDVVKSINTTSGEYMSTLDKMKAAWENWIPKVIHFVTDTTNVENKVQASAANAATSTSNAATIKSRGYAEGTTNATLGWHWVGEQGPELMYFEGGEQVINSNASQGILSQANTNTNTNTTTTGNGTSTDFMQQIADTIDQNSDKPAEATKKVAILVSKEVQKVKDDTVAQVKSLNVELDKLNNEETVALRGVKGAKRYAIEDEYNAKEKAVKDEIALRKDQSDKEIAEIKRIGSASKDELTQEIADRKDFVSSVNSLNDEIKDALKAKYTEEETTQEDALNKEITSLSTWKDDSEKIINDVYATKEQDIVDSSNAQIAALQAESDALDEQTAAESRASTQAGYTDKISDLKSQITYSHDDYDKAQLEKQLSQEQSDYQKELNSEAVSDKKVALKAQQDAIQIDADKQKAQLEILKQAELNNITSIYNAQNDSLNNQLVVLKSFYVNKLTDANLNAEAEKMVMQNNQNDIITLLNSYGDQYKQAGQTLGEMLADGFQPAIDSMKSEISSIINQLAASRSSAISALQTANAEVVTSSSLYPNTVLSSSNSIANNNSKNTVNNIAITSPVAQTPSQQTSSMTSTLRQLAYII